MTLLLIIAAALPLMLAPFSATASASRWLPLAALPALAAAILVPVGTSVELPWLMLGTHLALDVTARLFLLFSAIVWFAAAAYLAATPALWPPRGHFGIWYLLAMGGNLLLILAADMLTFYLGFALMGLSAYGLLLGQPGQRVRGAGRVYLAFTLVGELALFAALVLLVAHTGSARFADLADQPMPDAALALLLFGFGIKVALPGLHFWLPPAYSAGPIVAVAVLSGPMMKAGLLGWLRFIPPQSVDGEFWGTSLIALGALGALIGIGFGVLQQRPRAVLAFSSIAKMGLMSALFGAAILDPAHAPALLSALVLFAMHHLVVKSALFLGVAEWERLGSNAFVLTGLGVLVLTLVGAPLSGGAAAKTALAEVPTLTAYTWSTLLATAAVGTVLLMARFAYLLNRHRGHATAVPSPASVIWLILVILAFWAPFMPAQTGFELKAIWPFVGGLALSGLVWLASRTRRSQGVRNAPRGLLPIGIRWARTLSRSTAHLQWPAAGWDRLDVTWRLVPQAPVEVGLVRAGLRWLTVLAALLAATLVSR